MSLGKLIQIYNLIRLFRWFALIYISGYCISSFSNNLSKKTLIIELMTYFLIVLFSWVFAVGVVNLIKDIKEGGVWYHLKRTIRTIKDLFNGFF